VGILIDSSVFIAAERGRLALAERIRGHEHEPLAISALTTSELLHGVHRATDPRQRSRRARFVDAILTRFPVVEFGLEAARAHARLWAELLEQGHMVGAHDLIIGATAVALDFQVATVNARDFTRIPGLQVQVWTA
jgi:tRNA(fMet)-specific endonuclease VapC